MNTKKQTKKHKGNKGKPHLTQLQRDRIDAMFHNHQTQKDIARILGVAQSTISREINRNRRKIKIRGATKNGDYESSVAHHKAYVRRKYAKYQGKKINDNQSLENYIVDGLKKHWSPDEISGRMKYEQQLFYASKTAIYEWLYSSYGQKHCFYLYSKRFKPRKQNKGKKIKKTTIPNRISWKLRSEGAKNKTEYGHWQGDTVVSGKKTGSKVALSVIYEQKGKFVDVRRILNLKPTTNKNAINDMKQDKKVKSFLFDNGLENREYQKLNVPTYFCDAYSSWQKPGVENVNKILRWFFPKGCDINNYSEEYVKMVVDIINRKPRKSLGYKTAIEVMQENHLFTKIKVIKKTLSGEKINTLINDRKYALRG
jgi:IS30 family transposase